MGTMTVRKQRQRQKKHLRDRGRELAFQRRKAAFHKFPEICYEHAEVPPKFAEAVIVLVKDFIANHESLLSPRQAGYFHRLKQVGCRRVLMESRLAARSSGRASGPGKWDEAQETLMFSMGDYILSRMPSNIIQSYLPFSSIFIFPGTPRSTSILVRMQTLCAAQTAGGTAYFSPYRPTLDIDGRRWVVAFSDHAVRQLCERMDPDWRTYTSLAYTFKAIYDKTYFELWQPPHKQPGIVIYEHCAPGFAAYSLASKIAGPLDPQRDYCYRVGYCPAVLDSGFIKAKTLLLPGMDGTPEYQLCLRSLATTVMGRKELRLKAGISPIRCLQETGECELLKMFHDKGIPQVVTFDHRIIRCDTPKLA